MPIGRLFERLYRQSRHWQNLLNGFITLVVFLGLIYVFRGYLPDFRPDYQALLIEVERLQLRVEAYGIVAPVAFVGIYAVANSLFTPGIVLAVAAGLMFGFGPGLLLCLLGISVSCQTYFWAARYGGKPFIRWFGWEEWKLFRSEQTMIPATILFFRFNYFIPFHAFNAVCGARSVPFGRFLGFSLVGMTPAVAVGVFLGTTLDPGTKLIVPAISLWGVLAVARIVFGIWHMKRLVSNQTLSE